MCWYRSRGVFRVLPSTNAFLHFSQWPVGHAHLALLGAFGFLSVGVAYWVIPKITGREIYSKRVMNFDFWLMAVGFIFFFIAMTGTGLQQNSNWYTHINVVETLPTLKIWFVFRAMAGGLVVVSAFIFAYNIFMTLWFSRKPYSEEEHVVEAVRFSELPQSAFQLRSQRSGLAMIIVGGVSLFIIMSIMVIGMPYMFNDNTPGPLAHPLTDPEQRGHGTV